MTDLDKVRRMVEPIAGQFGLIGRSLLGKLTEENVRIVYREVGEAGIREAAEALIRIGKGDE